MGCTNSSKVERPERSSIIFRREPLQLSPAKVADAATLILKKKIRFIPKEPNWDDKVDSEFECIVCLEIKKSSLVSNCCMNVICQTCVSSLKKICPLRCDKLPKQFGSRKGLNERINKIFSICDLCLSEVHPWNLEKHKNKCGEKLLGDEVKILRFHNQTLLRKSSEKYWKCHARETVYEDHQDNPGDFYYECKNCELKFCRYCTAKAKFQGKDIEINNKKLDSSTAVLFKCEKTLILPPIKLTKKAKLPKIKKRLRKKSVELRPMVF
ncbi:unnamed protein product [Moneuplotes crassus]|uniref:RING-type domain-containing protein n=1 Tax=Euplotes crassus TaxID=5936 RepID=A0AAD2CZL0_EUPCR|nr:unnamed protein product [Moneuplotes crassus]